LTSNDDVCDFVAGSGVFTKQSFSAQDFLLEYHGELISVEDGEKRIAETPEKSTFMYMFEHNRKKML